MIEVYFKKEKMNKGHKIIEASLDNEFIYFVLKGRICQMIDFKSIPQLNQQIFCEKKWLELN